MSNKFRIDFYKIKNINNIDDLFDLIKSIIKEQYDKCYNSNTFIIELFLNPRYSYINIELYESNIYSLLIPTLYDIKLIYDKRDETIKFPININSSVVKEILNDFITISNLLTTLSEDTMIIKMLENDHMCEMYFSSLVYHLNSIHEFKSNFKQFKRVTGFIKMFLSDVKIREHITYIDAKIQSLRGDSYAKRNY